jgi:glucose/arabinose dehydrogenase
MHDRARRGGSLALLLLAVTSVSARAHAEVDLGKLKLPPGFTIEVFADVEDARQMALGEDGVVFVGSRQKGNVYAVKDGKTIVIDEGLRAPSGIAYRDGHLYVGAIHRILRYRDIHKNLGASPEPEVVTDKLPSAVHHGWKFMRFGPDGKLYVPVGAPCNVCDREPPFASILRLDVNAKDPELEVYARGVRNTVGFDWDPQTKELWFTDNGRDMLGDNLPSDELNHATEAGQHFGFPYCHQGDVLDPEFGKGRSCADYRPPMVKMGPHVAALGMTFYMGSMFPAQYKNQIFVAEHGSWNRTTPLGYRVAVVRVQDGKSSGQEVFAGGFYDGNAVMGRPVDVLELVDGSLLVSDDVRGSIYRITYRQ